MKKNLFTWLVSLLCFGIAQSQTPNLVVVAKYDPAMSGVYKPSGKYNNYDLWLGPGTSNRYYISFSKMMRQWTLGQWYGDTNSMWSDIYYLNSTAKYPTGVWNNGALEVQVEGPSLKYASAKLNESTSNDGSIIGEILISHNKFNGQAFAGQIGDDFVSKGFVSVTNLTSGLTTAMVKNNDSTLQLSISGNATDHSADTNFTIEFNNNGFTNGGKSDSTLNSKYTIAINFINVFTVGKSGAQFTSIDSALNIMKNGDILMVGEGTFTELVSSPGTVSDFTIIGAGPDKTIIQADTAPMIAKGRTLDFTASQNVTLENLTVQNGYAVSNNGYGGGINIQSGALTIRNCRVVNNMAYSTGQGQTTGGGIMCNKLKMYNCEVSGNIADNGTKSGQIQAGGLFAQEAYIENSTISGNFSRNTGGGCMLGNSMIGKPHQIINSTITNNESITDGGGVNTYYTTVITNSIIYGNKSGKGKDIFQTNSHVFTLGVTKSYIGVITGFQDKYKNTGTILSGDPMLDTLAFNCGVTRTHALKEGSPAIDSGLTAVDSVPSLDQRGFPVFLLKDIGAHEQVYQLQFEIGQDSICMEETELLTLSGLPDNGTFEGDGVTGNQFDPSKITKDGYVYITYKYTAPGCDNFSSVDSIYVRTCKVANSVKDVQLSVNVYPNPANDKVNIQLTNNSVMTASIADLSGKLLITQTEKGKSMSINIDDLPSGVYILSVESLGKKSVQKFIKL